MNLIQTIAELRTELKQIEEVISVLERLAYGRRKRRGRPPKQMASSEPAGKAASGKLRRKRARAASKAAK